MAQLWKKYRPDTLSHMVGLDGLKEDFPGWAVYEDNKHQLRCGGVIFNGPPGTGKTSAARAIGKDLLAHTFDVNYHEFNASDDRGIQFVRERLKGLAEQKAVNFAFKVINLDEADGLTKDAQDSLRQIIEESSTHTLWILTCNRKSRIIPALRSRLPSYSFPPLESDEAQDFLRMVIQEEGYPTEWLDNLPDLVRKSKGDLRHCLKTLQIANPDITNALERQLAGDTSLVDNLYDELLNKDFASALISAENIVKEGIARDEAIGLLHEVMLIRYSSDDANPTPLHTVLAHLLILGQWAARSPDWNAGDILFYHSLVGDIHQRG